MMRAFARKLIFLLTLLGAGYEGQAQVDAAANLEKYWNYRDRFLGKDGNSGFIVIGPDQGQSIPSSGRNPDCDCLRDWAIIQSQSPRHEGTGVLRWGDATVWLGYYTAMLAMEYKNLQLAGANTEATRRELYYALKAYERLDSLAEVTLGLPGALNGFFLRDDVPLDFYKSEVAGQRRFRNETKATSYDCVGSDYSKATRAVDNGTYVSQDQAIALLFGFAFVKKFAGDATYPEVEDLSFGDLAALYTHLIVQYMSEQKWRLRSPDGQKISSRWGGDVRAFSSLIATAAERITEGKFGYNYQERTFLGKVIKGSFGWAFGLHGDNNYSMIFQLMMINDQWTPVQFAKRSMKADNIPYALADAVLNDRKLHKALSRADYEALIQTAPVDGPCTGTRDCEAPEGWRSSDLWWHSNHKNGDPYGRTYEYPGIDYMLLYNLYHYYYSADLPPYPRSSQ